MDTVLAFLHENWSRLPVQEFGRPSKLSNLLLTPRFRASSHIITFVFSGENPAPIMVAKMPRLQGDTARLDKEFKNLNSIHESFADERDSIPRVIAYEDYHGARLLVETAVVGKPMKPAVVRRRTDACIDDVLEWLIDLNLATTKQKVRKSRWFSRLAEGPLSEIKNVSPNSSESNRLVDRTLELINAYCSYEFPLVVEHGDLSHPNLMFSENGGVGVVDWELAELDGLPVNDLFFFLAYVAFAKHKANANKGYLSAFRKAFFGDSAWATKYIDRYRERIEVPAELLVPTFVLCWSRYVFGLMDRLQDFNSSTFKVSRETDRWIRSNRFYALWRYTVEHISELRLESR